MQQSEFLKVALEAAKKAEEVIMKYYSDDIRVTLKSDQSPVTIADVEAEKAIIETIREAFPNHGFLGEESGDENIDNEYVWIIDPIDGTKNYMKQIPIFATLIALAHNGKLILGVSNAPAMHELAYAEKDKGAFINDKQVFVSKVDELKQAWINFGGLSYFEKNGHGDKILKLIRLTGRQRAFADYWQYHLLAAGKFEIALEGKVKIWDIAPFVVLIREAGGKVTDRQGNEINFDTQSFLATNGLLHDQVIKIINHDA